MGKTDEKIQEYSPFKIWGIFSVIGILFLVIVYGAVTNAECSQVKKNAETTLQFVRSLCRKYDDYRLGNLTRDLQIVINKSRTLSSYVKETQASLEEYTDMQDLTGSCILDADAKVVLRSGQRPLEEKALLKAIRKESNLKSIIQDSRKTYADQIELEGRYYNYALVARTKKPGVILCYDDITRTIADKNELSLGSLLAGDTFEGDAQIIVTDGKRLSEPMYPICRDLRWINVRSSVLTDRTRCRTTGNCLNCVIAGKAGTESKSFIAVIIYMLFTATRMFLPIVSIIC